MKIKQKRGRNIPLFLIIFVLFILFNGCNLFISLFDTDDTPPEPPPPRPTLEPPPYDIIGLYDAGPINVISGDAYFIIENGDYLYTAGENTFNVIDFSTPPSYTIEGSFNVVYVGGITTDGMYAYVQKDPGGNPSYGCVLSIDCSNLEFIIAGDSETLGYSSAYQVYYESGYLYSCSGSTVAVYDVRTPTAIVYKSEIATTNAQWGIVRNKYFYFAEYTSPGKMKICDFSDPAVPVLKATLETTSPYPKGIALSGNYAFIIFNNGTISVVDISNPASPVEFSDMTLSGGTSTCFSEMKIKDNYLYVSGNYDLYVVDAHDPYAMQEVGSIQTSVMGGALGFTLSKNYAIVADSYYSCYKMIRIDKNS
ncbi:MAG: hypothetical protein JXB88_03630 [Spirochaetales bacterium]|nr:hypothetical protein [Spirochaetales bacterium]